MVVIWSRSAWSELKDIVEFIALDSPRNADKVRNALIETSAELIKNIEKHPLDKFKSNNDGTWRAFELYRCRISYRIKKNEVRIVRVRHTKMSPLYY